MLLLVQHCLLFHALGIISLLNALTVTPPPFGQLSVVGTKLVGANGQPVQLTGNSLFWSTLAQQLWKPETIRALKCSWNANVVRAPMIVDMGGYIRDYMGDPNTSYNMMVTIIEAAIAEGIYVLVDWHTEHALADKASEFFIKIAQKYGSYPHILYEIYNEPLAVSWDNVLVPYHKRVISAIRSIDRNNVIIVGTPNWSQDVDVASRNQIREFKNIMYTFHMYAGTHAVNYLGPKLQTAINNGLPVFITEYGACEANGNGNLNYGVMQSWWDMVDNLKISYCNWAISVKSESCSVLREGTEAFQVGDPSHWTAYGNFVNAHNKKKATGLNCGGGGGGWNGGGGGGGGGPPPPNNGGGGGGWNGGGGGGGGGGGWGGGGGGGGGGPPPPNNGGGGGGWGGGGQQGGSSARVSVEYTQRWNGGGNVVYAVTNTGSRPLCNVMFRINFPPGTSPGGSWNMNNNGNNQFTATNRVDPGQTNKAAGMTLNGGGMPTANVLSANPC